MRQLAAAALLLALWSPVAHALGDRTDQLYWKCAGQEKLPEVGLLQCAGYIDGILDMHSMMVGFVKAPPMFCLPQTGISVDQAMRVFMQWVERNPDKMHLGARGSVVIALGTAFPCPR